MTCAAGGWFGLPKLPRIHCVVLRATRCNVGWPSTGLACYDALVVGVLWVCVGGEGLVSRVVASLSDTVSFIVGMVAVIPQTPDIEVSGGVTCQ